MGLRIRRDLPDAELCQLADMSITDSVVFTPGYLAALKVAFQDRGMDFDGYIEQRRTELGREVTDD